MTQAAGPVPTAIVTGAAGGIGNAVVLGLVEDGVTVIAVDLPSNQLDELAVTAAKGNGTAITVAGDVRDDSTLRRAIGTAEDLGQGIGMLIPAAAVYAPAEPAELSFDQWREFLSINTDAVFRLTSMSLPHLRNGSSITYFSSISAHKGAPLYAHYAASKAAIEGYARSLAVALGPQGVRVNTVAPGLIETQMTADVIQARGDTILQQVPLGRPGHPAEVADLVRFLSSPQASYITGQTVHINGGLYLT